MDEVEWEIVRADIAMEKARLEANGDWAKWRESQSADEPLLLRPPIGRRERRNERLGRRNSAVFDCRCCRVSRIPADIRASEFWRVLVLPQLPEKRNFPKNASQYWNVQSLLMPK